MGASPDVVQIALAQPLLLLVAWAMGMGARILMRGRVTVAGATMTVISVLGISLGLLLAGWLTPDLTPLQPRALLWAFAVDVVLLLLASAVLVTTRSEPPMPLIEEVLAAGESEQVEFKSTARWNLRTDKRDERMELVIAKTVAAFLNSSGGTLLIGIDDDGRMLGLANDLSTLRQPDIDRFELWLRDMLQTRLDTHAAALPQVGFITVTADHVDRDRADASALDSPICRVTCPSSPEPVYLHAKPSPELWVRVGNSTRSLPRTTRSATSVVVGPRPSGP